MQPYFKTYTNEKGPYSNWSERHIAYATGLGTFSLSDGLITERGIAIRCGTVVTSLVLPASPRTASSPYSNCLAYVGVDCRACINRCPAGAIDEKGHDKNKCEQHLLGIGYSMRLLQKNGYDNEKSVAGCGLCQTKVPCEFQNPTTKVKT
jgi:epoxyqueuosine reductase QueG